MRHFAAVSLFVLLVGCEATPESASPSAPDITVTESAIDAAPSAPVAQAHPAAAAFDSWVTDGTTIVVQADGVGPVMAGAANLAPYTVKASEPGRLVLVTNDGTEYTFELGESPRLSVSSLPDLILTPHR